MRLSRHYTSSINYLNESHTKSHSYLANKADRARSRKKNKLSGKQNGPQPRNVTSARKIINCLKKKSSMAFLTQIQSSEAIEMCIRGNHRVKLLIWHLFCISLKWILFNFFSSSLFHKHRMLYCKLFTFRLRLCPLLNQQNQRCISHVLFCSVYFCFYL